MWSDVCCDITWVLSLTFGVSMIHLLLAEPCNVMLTSPTDCTQWRYLWCPVVGPTSMNLALKWVSWTPTSWIHGGDVAVSFWAIILWHFFFFFFFLWHVLSVRRERERERAVCSTLTSASTSWSRCHGNASRGHLKHVIKRHDCNRETF